MSAEGRAALVGIGTALGISFVGALVAQVADALRDEQGLPGWFVALCVGVVLLGPLVGAAVSARRHPARPIAVGATVGAVALAAVATLSLARAAVGGHDTSPRTLPVIILLGALLGCIGAAAGSARPARTRS
jgi:peptidoglycan/LPS O-acetylase OafA/YrhL